MTIDGIEENRRMKQMFVTLLTVVAVTVSVAAQPSPLVTDVRAAIKANDLSKAAAIVATFRKAQGVTPEMLEALSWVGRGALAAGDLDQAERVARETYDLSTALLKSRTLDQEPRLPIALGAAIEVLGQVQAQRHARTDAVVFLQQQFRNYERTSIAKRIQKNINLISLEGQPAPPLDLTEHLGPTPPTLASLKGKVVLLFFWAHWCSDCKQVGPVLSALAEQVPQPWAGRLRADAALWLRRGRQGGPRRRGVALHRSGAAAVLSRAGGPTRPSERGQSCALRRELDADAGPRGSRRGRSSL